MRCSECWSEEGYSSCGWWHCLNCYAVLPLDQQDACSQAQGDTDETKEYDQGGFASDM